MKESKLIKELERQNNFIKEMQNIEINVAVTRAMLSLFVKPTLWGKVKLFFRFIIEWVIECERYQLSEVRYERVMK